MTWALKSLKNFHFNGLLLGKVYIAWAKKGTEELLFFMTLKIDAKLEEKLICCLENDKEFHKFSSEHSKVSKVELWWDPFIQSRKYVSLKFTEKLCIMTMKNDTKIEEKLTCRLKIDMRNFINFDLSTRKSKKFVF